MQEAAALQTFRRAGIVGHVAEYRQIGNAVPPNLAEAVAKSVYEAMRSTDALARADDTQAPIAA